MLINTLSTRRTQTQTNPDTLFQDSFELGVKQNIDVPICRRPSSCYTEINALAANIEIIFIYFLKL